MSVLGPRVKLRVQIRAWALGVILNSPQGPTQTVQALSAVHARKIASAPKYDP